MNRAMDAKPDGSCHWRLIEQKRETQCHLEFVIPDTACRYMLGMLLQPIPDVSCGLEEISQ